MVVANKGEPRGGLGHLPAIDGLRAIAVMAVTLYHIDPAVITGGFAGVDIFYVISGFVVTLSILSRSTTSDPNFISNFYRRRIARIAPASLLYIFVALLFSALFIPAVPQTKWIEPIGIASAFGMGNFLLAAKGGDYFSASSAFNPFTHTWSLAVEEQFYLLFPLLAIPMLLSGEARTRRNALAIFFLVCVASFAAAVVGLDKHPIETFYLLFGRIWELGLGVIACVLSIEYLKSRSSNDTRLRVVSNFVAPICLLAISHQLFYANEARFPAFGALLIVFATATLLSFVLINGAGKASVADRFLSLSWIQWLGRVSYSLYLWHWGVIVAARWTVGLDTVLSKLVVFCLIILFAALSYYWVERRVLAFFALGGAAKRIVLLSWIFSLGVVTGVGLVAIKFKPEFGLSVANKKSEWSPYYVDDLLAESACKPQTTKRSFLGGEVISIKSCSTGSPASRHLYVMGDSHAAAYQRMVWRYVRDAGYDADIYTMGGCRALEIGIGVATRDCRSFRDAALEEIARRATAADFAFLPGLLMPRLRDNWSTKDADTDKLAGTRSPSVAMQLGLDPAIKRLLGSPVKVVIEGPKPVLSSAPFRCSDWFNRDSQYCVSKTQSRLEFFSKSSFIADQLKSNLVQGRVVIWSPAEVLCETENCSSSRYGKSIYFDVDHISAFGNDILFPDFWRFMRQLEVE